MQAIPNAVELARLRAQLVQLRAMVRAATVPGVSIDAAPVMTRQQVERRLLIAPATLQRWREDPELNFPQPMLIDGEKIWITVEIDAFLDRMGEYLRVARRDGHSFGVLKKMYGQKVTEYLLKQMKDSPDADGE